MSASASGGDYLAGLTTDPIFDDAVYLSEALGLPSGQTEEDIEAHLFISARESGIEHPYRFLCPELHDISTAISTFTAASDPRSSMSIHSRETQSTGITSHPSRTSKDNPYMESTSAVRTPSTPTTPAISSRGSTSFDCYDTVLDRFRPSIRHRLSSSQSSNTRTHSALSNSALSSSYALPKPTPPKVKRKSGLFSMFRKDDGICPSRSHHGHHSNPLNPKLDCGHSLSKYAIRVHIQEALASKEHVAPSCCGILLPRAVLETVLSREETDIVTAEKIELPMFDSVRDYGYGEEGLASIDLPRPLSKRSHATEFFIAAPDAPRKDEEVLNRALANEAFRSLRTQQKQQFERISAFEANQRKALSAYHEWTLKRLSSEVQKAKAEKPKQYATELERLEELQIVAEHELRNTHAQETQNVATALKHMEAYCSGSNLTTGHYIYTVTEEDREKLARQYMIQKKMPKKHESAINVLRARQEKNLITKQQKQQAALKQLDLDYECAKQEEELRFLKDSNQLNLVIAARRRRLTNRWDLKFEMWRRDWESQHRIALQGRLPHEEWPENRVEGPIDASSSLALYLQIMV